MSDHVSQPDPAHLTRALRLPPTGSSTDGSSAACDVVRAMNMAAASQSQESDPTAPRLCKADIARDDLTGFSLGQYALGQKIGRGGMGKVFAARHIHLNRTFAIKFLGSDVSHVPEAQLRFEQETLALGKLEHQHIVNAVDAGCVDGLRFLVTEFIDGEDLMQFVHRRGKIPVGEACELIYQSALGLAHSHRCGFVHRDIKPSNLIVNQNQIVKILDFGLVRTLEVDLQLTENGEMLGTWDFVAPEQANDASQVDCRCDIYSLGCTLLYLLSGQTPFNGARYATPAAKLKGHLFEMPPCLATEEARIPDELAALLRRMLAKSPADRVSTCDEVAELLSKILQSFKKSASLASVSPGSDRWRPRFLHNRNGVISWRRTGLLLMLTIGLLVTISVFPQNRVVTDLKAAAVETNAESESKESIPQESITTDPVVERSQLDDESASPEKPTRQTLAPKESFNATLPALDLFESSSKTRMIPSERGR